MLAATGDAIVMWSEEAVDVYGDQGEAELLANATALMQQVARSWQQAQQQVRPPIPS